MAKWWRTSMRRPVHRVLILGGYGFFGERIATALASDPNLRLSGGGRDLAKAQGFARRLGLDVRQGVAIDAAAQNLANAPVKLEVNTVMHTAGPFQGQGYAVARASIDAGCNYIDLADGREFVSGIGALDSLA